MTGVHTLLTTIGFTDGSGPAWVLSIVGLTIVVRALMIPLFNKQTKAARLGQELNPEIQKIQKKYKGKKDQVSQQKQQEEMMALYREHGTSPFASCMPLLIQMPIFFALFRLLYAILPLSKGTYGKEMIGPIDEAVAKAISNSTLFGAPLTSSIGTAKGNTNIIVVAVILIAGMIVTLFFTQKQIMTKNLPESSTDPNNPAYKMQKYMLYGMPMIYIFTGTTFQVGVLVYWLTGNVWNIGQQTWMINNNPAPGSEAYKKRQEKIRQNKIKKGIPLDEIDEKEEKKGQRIQPVSKKRAKKKGASNIGSLEEKKVGADGLTDAERAQKRYERRQAQRKQNKKKNK